MNLKCRCGGEPSDPDPPSRTVVRVTTSVWADSRGMHCKRDLVYLRRQCSGHNGLLEDSHNIDPKDALPVNFLTVPDGVYEVRVCNVSRDPETGYADDWDRELVPLDRDRERQP